MNARAVGGHLFLLEIGTEEIPARMVVGALSDLTRGLVQELEARHLLDAAAGDVGARVRSFGTPRRLAVMIRGLREREPDEETMVTGPPIKAAYDSTGRPTRAAEGFARAQGVTVDHLLRETTPRGECVAVRRQTRGRAAGEVLAEVVPAVIDALSFPETMRWGAGVHRFVRPIHSLVALLDDRVIEFTYAGVHAGRGTFGHRCAGRRDITLKRADDYPEAMRDNGVIADIEERRRVIADGLSRAAAEAGGRIAAAPGPRGVVAEAGDPELLDEVVQLVEWPTVLCGSFDADFLELPAEVLVTAMRHHQKYFSLVTAGGALMGRFLVVANVMSDRQGAILRGNEWVLRARLADARFFYDEDRRIPLIDRVAALERVTFHEKLGSYADKTSRIITLCRAILPFFRDARPKPDRDAVLQAAQLCKADLTTQVVREFPELQGIIGGLYARADGAPEAVWRSIYDHYLPAGSDDPIPSTPGGAVLSLADRLDTQAASFLLGEIPTGSRDPYGLRRSVQGVCRILIETGVQGSLAALIDAALGAHGAAGVPGGVVPETAASTLLEFYRGRQEHLGVEAGLRPDSVRAALAAGSDDPLDARLRMQALDAIRRESGFDRLSAAHKRIKNIVTGQPESVINEKLVGEKSEKALHDAVVMATESVEAALREKRHLDALRTIGSIGAPLDDFFENVMVMTDDPKVRMNRIALLRTIGVLFMRIGDFSEIILEGAAPPPTKGRVC